MMTNINFLSYLAHFFLEMFGKNLELRHPRCVCNIKGAVLEVKTQQVDL